MKALVAVALLALLSGCKTKSDVLREQQIRRLQKDLQTMKTNRADGQITNEEMKMEISRLSSLIELQSQQIDKMQARLTNVEKAVAQEDARKAPVPAERKRLTYEMGQSLFKQGKFIDAMQVLKEVIKESRPDSPETRKAQFLLAESYFANKDYALAALEYAQYKKAYPNDSLVPRAIYQQANCFRKMGKNSEAKLFYQELFERFPKHALVANAKKEAKTLK